MSEPEIIDLTEELEPTELNESLNQNNSNNNINTINLEAMDYFTKELMLIKNGMERVNKTLKEKRNNCINNEVQIGQANFRVNNNNIGGKEAIIISSDDDVDDSDEDYDEDYDDNSEENSEDGFEILEDNFSPTLKNLNGGMRGIPRLNTLANINHQSKRQKIGNPINFNFQPNLLGSIDNKFTSNVELARAGLSYSHFLNQQNPNHPMSQFSRSSVPTLAQIQAFASKNATQLKLSDQVGYSLERNKYSQLRKELRESYRPIEELGKEEYDEMYKTLLSNINDKNNLEKVETPLALNIELLEHQKIGLNWMIKMELGDIKGGLLSDDMGLGKTIQTLATIVHSKTAYYDRCKTLIIAPLALIHQWYDEIQTKVKSKFLITYIYHGSQKTIDTGFLSRQDIVLTTYSTLAQEFKRYEKEVNPDKLKEDDVMFKDLPPNSKLYPLLSIQWNRIILDEAHCIKNRNTVTSKACRHLKSKFRWCLSGTPLQNSVDDLYPIIAFLKVKPYCKWYRFSQDLRVTAQNKVQKTSFKKIRTLLEAISLRRTKDSLINGKPILTLPEKEIVSIEVEFSLKELEFYKQQEAASNKQFQKYLKLDKSKRNYMSILVLLLRLRQTCCHPALTISKNVDKELVNDELNDLDLDLPKLDDKISHSILVKNDLKDRFELDTLDRLIKMDFDEVECYSCRLSNLEFYAISPCAHIYCSSCLPNTSISNSCDHCQNVEPFQRIPLNEIIKLNLSDNSSNNPTPDRLSPPLIANEMDLNEPLRSPSSAKIDQMISTIQSIHCADPQSKIIVFTQFVSLFPFLSNQLNLNNINHSCYNGLMDIMERQASIKEFNNNKNIKVLVMSLKCGSVGLNLTAAKSVIFMDMWWNPAIESQAMDRVHRIGQTSLVKVYKLVIKETVEDRILKLQEKKQQIFDNVFQNGDSTTSSKLSLQDLKFLFSSHHHTD